VTENKSRVIEIDFFEYLPEDQNVVGVAIPPLGSSRVVTIEDPPEVFRYDTNLDDIRYTMQIKDLADELAKDSDDESGLEDNNVCHEF